MRRGLLLPSGFYEFDGRSLPLGLVLHGWRGRPGAVPRRYFRRSGRHCCVCVLGCLQRWFFLCARIDDALCRALSCGRVVFGRLGRARAVHGRNVQQRHGPRDPMHSLPSRWLLLLARRCGRAARMRRHGRCAKRARCSTGLLYAERGAERGTHGSCEFQRCSKCERPAERYSDTDANALALGCARLMRTAHRGLRDTVDPDWLARDCSGWRSSVGGRRGQRRRRCRRRGLATFARAA